MLRPDCYVLRKIAKRRSWVKNLADLEPACSVSDSLRFDDDEEDLEALPVIAAGAHDDEGDAAPAAAKAVAKPKPKAKAKAQTARAIVNAERNMQKYVTLRLAGELRRELRQ